jgi:hypothetical protein
MVFPSSDALFVKRDFALDKENALGKVVLIQTNNMPHPITTQIPTILKYISKSWAWPLRFYYTSARLEKFLYLDISASGDPINYNYHSQDASCYLKVYNLSPFDFTIDRIRIEVFVDGIGSFSCMNITPYSINGMSYQQIYVHSSCSMTSESAQRAKEKNENRRARVNIEAQIITSIRSFPIWRNIEQLKNVYISA